MLDMASDLELTVFYRVCEERPSNQRVVLKLKTAKVTLHSVSPR